MELGNQIKEFFLNYFINNSEGIITLIDAYHYYNRARGMSNFILFMFKKDTISPKEMRRAIEILENTNSNNNSSINFKTFKNDMILLFTGKIFLNFFR